MDVDFEVEIGGGAPVIEAHWPGFIDLRAHPERLSEIPEADSSPPLKDLLLALNSAESPVWTSKCGVWTPEPGALACYIDLLPLRERVFAEWQTAEACCRALVERIVGSVSPVEPAQPERHHVIITRNEPEGEGNITLVVRQAVTEAGEGFGITAYFSAGPSGSRSVDSLLRDVMAAFSKAMMSRS